VESGKNRSPVTKRHLVRTICLGAALLLIAVYVHGGNRVPDSTRMLWKGLQQFRPDAARVSAMISLGNYLVSKPGAGRPQLDSALIQLDRGLMLAKKLHLPALEFKCRQAALTNTFLILLDTAGAFSGYHTLINSFRRIHDPAGEAECWIDYGKALAQNNKDLAGALTCYSEGKRLFLGTGNNFGAALALKYSGMACKAQGRFTESAERLKAAGRYFKSAGKRTEQISCEVELAGLYWTMGNTQQAFYYNTEALNTAKTINDDSWTATVTNALGRQYFNLRMYEEALPYFERSLAATFRTRSAPDYSIALLTVVNDRVMLKRTRGLLEYLIRADHRMPLVEDIDRINLYCAYGLVYSSTGQKATAESWFLKMMSTFSKLRKQKAFGNNGHLFLQTYSKTIGQFYLDAHQEEKARPYFEKVMALPSESVSPASAGDVHLALYQIDSAAGRYRSAIRHLKIYHTIHDSLFNAGSANQVAALKARYAAERKSKDLAVIRGQQRSQAILVQQTKLERNITLGGIAALLIITGLAYWAYRKKQRINRHLEVQKARIDDQNSSLQSLLEDKNLLLAEKETLLTEKDWLLKEVHHRVKNNLQVITSLLNFQSGSTKETDVLEAIKTSRNRIQAISLIHLKLSNGNNLASLNMQSYVSELIGHLAEVFGLSSRFITFDRLIEPIEIDLKQAVPIGLILNEAITNSIKYAFTDGGGEISLVLKMAGEQDMLLEIADNGKGIPDDVNPFKTGSLGFKIMRGLSAQLKGDLKVMNDGGTRILLRFPLRAIKCSETISTE
jgi:two-component sensor histidine kinase